jgi:7-keto-8-aminopelargonate synthetase-like enzyme
MRSYASGFIFTTALPPAVCVAATAAIRHLKTSQWERDRHQVLQQVCIIARESKAVLAGKHSDTKTDRHKISRRAESKGS